MRAFQILSLLCASIIMSAVSTPIHIRLIILIFKRLMLKEDMLPEPPETLLDTLDISLRDNTVKV